MLQNAAKLVEDACYPEDVMGEFKNFKVSSVDDMLPAYNLMLLIIKPLNGDHEKFYRQFYKAFSSIKSLQNSQW